MSVIDEVKQKTDIVEIIGQYTPLKKAGKNLTGLCPFHSEKHASFFVYPEQQSWHCFGACSTGGDVFSFIMKKENLDFGEALRLLAQRAGVTLPSRTEAGSSKEEKEEQYKINEAAALYYHNLLINSPAAETARSYVNDRGFSAQTITDFQLGFSLDSWESLKKYLRDKGFSESAMITAGLLIESENGKSYDRFRGKLIIPILDIRGRVIGFGARALDDSLPKYTNSPQTPTFDKSNTLFGINLASSIIRQQDKAIIMEGYMDVITAHQNDVKNVVASMGTAITEPQITMIKKLSRNLVMALDADTAGEEAMLRGVNYENTLNAEIRIINLPEGKDPDNVIRENIETWRELVEKAVPIIDYTFEKVISELDLTTARDKSLSVERLLPIVSEISDPVRQAHYMQKLARLAGVTERTLEATLSRLKPSTIRRKTLVKPPSAPILKPLVSSPLEADCLTLILRHPELKDRSEELLPEYFNNAENHEIFVCWQQTEDLSSLRERLDPALHQQLDSIIGKHLASNDIEQRYIDYTLRLRERHLKNRAAKISAILAIETDTDSPDSHKARLTEEVTDIRMQLQEVESYRKHKRPELRR